MGWSNLHTHCHFCDGENEPRAYIDEAIRQGMKGLGFSSHAPLPFPCGWVMKQRDLARYCQEIRSLQQEVAEQLPVFLGLEIDFIPGMTGPHADRFTSFGLDYTIGSVHHVGIDAIGKPWSIDTSIGVFTEGLETLYHGDMAQVVERYYALVHEMVQTSCPDVVAHLDLVKKNNASSRYFSEDAPWYREAVFHTLETIAASGAIVEVNTGGLARKRTYDLYPSRWILDRCRELGIPITLSSDAHRPEQVTALFEEVAGLLREIGYEELTVLTSDGWRAERIEQQQNHASSANTKEDDYEQQGKSANRFTSPGA